MAPGKVLITGCSGGGKSTLLAELARRGHRTVAEPGRRVIARERVARGDALPWRDPVRFLRACLAMAEADFAAAGAGLTVFDRGVIDAVAGLRRIGFASDGTAEGAAALARCRYDRVFLAPPWEELFVSDPDPDRCHDFPAAVREYDDLSETLRALGYLAVAMPKTGVAARADWVETALRTG